VKFAKKISLGKDVSVKTLIHQRVPGMEPPRSTHTIHASDLTNEDKEFCPRAIILMDIAKKKGRATFIGTSLRLTYDLGRRLQDDFNNVWLSDVMHGNWLCISCKGFKTDCTKPMGHCGKTGITCNWMYREPRFMDGESGLDGGIDGVVDVGESKLRMVETKTIEKDGFGALKAPLSEHRLRTNLYLRLIALDGRDFAKKINTQVGHLLYICKGFGKKDEEIVKKKGVRDAAFSPFKEYKIKRDDSATDLLIAKARAVTVGRKSGGVPCGICKTSMEKRAKICPVIKECWSGKYPAKVKWE